MDSVINTILTAISSGGAIAIVGWGMFFLERFYVAPKREDKHGEEVKLFKETIDGFREDHKDTSAKTVEALHRLTTLLEVVKDRATRGS